MVCITGTLVFIQSNRSIPIAFSDTVSPHESFTSSRTSIPITFYRHFVCLYYVETIQFLVQLIVQKTIVTLDDSIGHDLTSILTSFLLNFCSIRYRAAQVINNGIAILLDKTSVELSACTTVCYLFQHAPYGTSIT